MQNKILKLISSNPKHYVQLIQKDPVLKNWVTANSLIDSTRFVEIIYSAVHQQSNICSRGNIKKFKRISSGFGGCGPANICECTKQSISKNVSLTKSAVSSADNIIINNRRANTMLAKYGVVVNSQRLDIKHIWKKSKISDYAANKLTDREWLYAEYIIKQRSLVDIANELTVYYSTVGEYCRSFDFPIRQRSQYSIVELEIIEYINSLGIQCEHGNWDLIGKELDIYIPSKQIAIEVNGLYWHAYHPSCGKIENKTRHIEKTLAAKSAGIELLHVTDFEWDNKKDIIKSIIKSKLGINDRIYARQCCIKLVSKQEEKQFLNTHHLQGYIASSLAVGLYHNNILVSLMTFGKPRYSKQSVAELLRFCSISNVTVVGGGSKLLKTAMTHYRSIITYCDISKSSGNSYRHMGFDQISTTGPGYFWTDGNDMISRYRCQKKQLARWLGNFSNMLTETENMFANKYRRYHDCGNYVFLIQQQSI